MCVCVDHIFSLHSTYNSLLLLLVVCFLCAFFSGPDILYALVKSIRRNLLNHKMIIELLNNHFEILYDHCVYVQFGLTFSIHSISLPHHIPLCLFDSLLPPFPFQLCFFNIKHWYESNFNKYNNSIEWQQSLYGKKDHSIEIAWMRKPMKRIKYGKTNPITYHLNVVWCTIFNVAYNICGH